MMTTYSNQTFPEMQIEKAIPFGKETIDNVECGLDNLWNFITETQCTFSVLVLRMFFFQLKLRESKANKKYVIKKKGILLENI
jgi:hypothetical protein